MKKYISIVSVLILAACAKESLPKGENELLRTETLTARIVNTKVNVDAAGKFSWTEGDEIAVHRTVNGYETATLTGDGAFNVHLADGESRDGYAVYPASVATDAASLTVNLPTAYTIPKTGMADYSPLPMVAVNDPASDDLFFHHVGGIIRLVLDKVPYETQKIVVNLGKKVTGDFVVDNPDSDTPSIALSAGTAEDIVFTLASPVNNALQNGFVINIPVPVGTYETVSVELYNRYDQFVLERQEEISVVVERADGYEIGSDLYVDVSTIPLCIQMAREGQISVDNQLALTMEYSLDNETWTSFNSDLTLDHLARGVKVYFRGSNSHYAERDENVNNGRPVYTNFRATAKCYLYGNVMSLITPLPENFSTLRTLSDPYTFYRLFYSDWDEGIGNFFADPEICSHPAFDLLLPATELTDRCYCEMLFLTGIDRMDLPATTMKESCYNGMFSYCHKMRIAPKLPAADLAEKCYEEMFSNCINLEVAPELPAATMKYRCYAHMFSGCYRLASAPALRATALAEGCYTHMFDDCPSLTTAPELPASELANSCYESMFRKCSSLLEAPALRATTLCNFCYENMFERCVSLVRAPELPATTLPDMYCYREMFKDCSSLNYVKAMFITNPTQGDDYNSNIRDWLSGVSETGTFVMNSAAAWDPVTDLGVPSGWTIETASE